MYRGLTTAVLCAWLAGCGGNAELGAPCRAGEGHCAAGLECGFGRCRMPCTTTASCACDPAAGPCDNGVCVRAPEAVDVCTLEPERRCSRGEDCPSPLVCADGRCQSSCQDDQPCPRNARCADASGGEPPLCSFEAEVTPGTDAGPDDAGARPPPPPVLPSGWSLPAECVPPADDPVIGQGCAPTVPDGGAAGSDAGTGSCRRCDVERSVTLIPANAPGESFDYTHSPGGTCVADLARAGETCDDIDCGTCGRCIDYGGEVACRDRCDPNSAYPNGGCRSDYACDPVRRVCLHRCADDRECRLRYADGMLTLDAASELTCDAESGLCRNATGSRDVGARCDEDSDCAADLYCLQARSGELRPVVPCEGEACARFEGGFCTRPCESGRGLTRDGCPEGSRCASIPGVTPAPICAPTCEVGADAPEDIDGVFGHGAGCRDRYACHPIDANPEGVCLPGLYTGVRETNVGAPCTPDGQTCRSPYGLGRCDPVDRFCTIYGCDHRVLSGADVCGPDAVCWSGRCRPTCAAGSDCEPGAAPRYCVDVAGADEGFCSATCTDASCPAGYRCLRGACVLPGAACALPTVDVGGLLGDRGAVEVTLPLVAGDSELAPFACGFAPSSVTGAVGVTYRAPIGGDDRAVGVSVETSVASVRVAAYRSSGSCEDLELLSCGSSSEGPVTVAAGESLHVLVFTDEPSVAGAVTFDVTEVPVVGLGERCEGSRQCVEGLVCEGEAGGPQLCVLPSSCGGIAVLDLVAESSPDPAGSGSIVHYDRGSGLEGLSGSCGAAPSGEDVLFRYEGVPSELLFVASSDGRASLHDGCPGESAELGCGSAAEGNGLLLDLSDQPSPTVLLEGRELRWETLARPLEGEPCDLAAGPCAPGLACALDASSGAYRCVDQSASCGEGVLELGRLAGGETREIPLPVQWLPLADPCGGPAGVVVHLVADEPLEVALARVGPGAAPRIAAWRGGCGVGTPTCRAGTLPVDAVGYLEPDEELWIAVAPSALEPGVATLALSTEAVQLDEEPCGEERCYTGQRCIAGFCGEICGNGVIGPGEHCDPGPSGTLAGCSGDCLLEDVQLGVASCGAPPEMRFTEETPGGSLVGRYRLDPGMPSDAPGSWMCTVEPTFALQYFQVTTSVAYTVEGRWIGEPGAYIGVWPGALDCTGNSPLVCRELDLGWRNLAGTGTAPAGTYRFGVAAEASAGPRELIVRITP